MATVYWFGGSGNWSDHANHWSNNSGNSPASLHGAAPGNDDDVVFDVNSASEDYTVTVDVSAAYCKNMTWGNPSSGKPTFAGTGNMVFVYGSLSLVASMGFTYSKTLSFCGGGDNTLNTAGVTLSCDIEFAATGDSYGITFQSNITLSGIKILTLKRGYLDTDGYDVSCYDFLISGTSNKSLVCGDSIISMTGPNGFSYTNSGVLTFDCGTSSIRLNYAEGGAIGPRSTAPLSGLVFYEVQLNNSGATTVMGANTFTNLIVNGRAALTAAVIFPSGKTQTITNLSLTGNSVTYRLFVKSDGKGSVATLDVTNWTSVSKVDIRDINSVGSIDLSGVSGGSGDCGGNTNITFTTADIWYFHEAASGVNQWSTIAKWFTATNGGGSTATYPPLPQDTARFDENSFDSGSKVVLQNMPRIGSVDWTGVTNTPEWTTNYAASCFGSIKLIADMILTASTEPYVLEGRGDNTIDCAGQTWAKSIRLECAEGSLTLKSNFLMSSSRSLYIATGTFSTIDGENNWSLSVGSMTIGDSSSAIVYLGSATHLINNPGGGWICGANAILYSGTSTIKFAANLTGYVSFAGGGKEYYNFWNATTGNYLVSILGSNSFNDFKIDAGREVNFKNSSITTVTTFTALGTPGSHIVLHNSSGTTHATLSKAGGGVISGCDYIDASYLTGSPDLTWYIGVNSSVSNCTNIYLAPTSTTNIQKGIIYLIDVATSATKSLKYAMRAPPAAKTKGLIYDIKITPSAVTKSLAYSIKTVPAAIEKSLQYTIKGPVSAITKGLVYDIKTTPTEIRKGLRYFIKSPAAAITKSIEYRITFDTVNITKDLTYTIKSAPAAIQKGLVYDILSATPVLIQKDIVYAVKAPASITKGLVYTVKSAPAAITKGLAYAIKITPSAITKSLAYSIGGKTTIQKGLIYAVETTPTAITKSLSYRVLFQTENIQKGLAYDVKAPVGITKGLVYGIKTIPAAITKAAQYAVLTQKGATLGLQYEIKTIGAITKQAAYTIKTAPSVTKGLQYVVASQVSLTKSLKYTIEITPAAISKGLQYQVMVASAITKSVQYAVKPSQAITKGLRYELFSQVLIQKSLAYGIETQHAITKGLEYKVAGNIAVQKSLEYTVKRQAVITKALQYVVRIYPYKKQTLTPYVKKVSPYKNLIHG